MAQYVLINPVGTRRAGEVLDSVQDGQAVIDQLVAFGGVLVPLPNALLQPYIDRCQSLTLVGNYDEATAMMQAAYASSTSIAGGGTAGFVPIWTAGSVLGDSVIKQSGSLVGINVAAPTAALSLPAGAVAAASLNFATGVAPGAPNSGDTWFDGTYLYLRAVGVNQPLNAPFGTGTPNVLTKWSSVSGLTDTAITEASGAIRTIGITNAGAGATAGTYYQQTLTTVTGTGTGATANIVTAGGIVTVLVLMSPGTGYAVGDTLSCGTIGGSGYVFTVTAVSASDNATGNLTAQRIGAGTTNPIAGLDIADAAAINGFSRFFPVNSISNSTGAIAYSSGWQMLAIGTRSADYDLSSVGTSFFYPINIAPVITNLSGNLQGIQLRPILKSTSGTAQASGYVSLVSRTAASDLATISHNGFNALFTIFTGASAAASYSQSTVRGAIASLNFNAPGTTTEATGFRATIAGNSTHAITASQGFWQEASTFSGGTTVTDFYGFRLGAITVTSPSTITNAYGLRLEAFAGTGTITNRWGVSQEDAAAKNRLLGNAGVGVDPGTGKVIASLTLTAGGTLYTGGYYAQVPLTGGTGSGATADIATAGGAVVGVTLRNPGQGYVVGDVLSCAAASVGGTGSGFQTTVATIASILRSDGTVIGARIGAGTTNPSMSIYAAGAIGASKFERRYFTDIIVSTLGTRGGTVLQINDTQSESTGVFLAQATLDPTIYGSLTIPRVDFSAISVTTFGYGSYSRFICENPTSAGTTAIVGGGFESVMNTAATGKTIALRGVFANMSLVHLGAGNTISFMRSVDAQSYITTTATQTITDHSMIDCLHSTNTAAIQNTTNFYALRSRAHVWTGAAHTVTNFYGVLLQAPSLSSGSTITNRWSGISHEDALGKSRFYGNVGVGNALDVGTGKVISSLTLTNAGAGATNGTYSQVALTGGSGTGATADIVVAGNVVTSLSLRGPGQGYVVGDTLSTAAIGGTGFVFTVASTASILRSDGTAVAARVGAGTATPRAALDAQGGGMLSGMQLNALYSSAAGTTGFYAYTALQIDNSISASNTFVIPAGLSSGAVRGINASLRVDASNVASGGVSNYGAAVLLSIAEAGGGSLSAYGGFFSAAVNTTGLSGKTVSQFFGCSGQTIIQAAGGTNTFSDVAVFFCSNSITATTAQNVTKYTLFNGFFAGLFSGAAHAVTNYYGIQLGAPTLSGGSTITNRWGVSQEDTLAKNQLLGNVGVGIDPGVGKVIASLTLTNAGAGATNGTYSQVALTGGSGTGATADIVVAGNVVTSLSLRSPGQGYVVGDTLSTAAIGGAGFVFTVASTASILRSDGTVVAPRIGAGTATPRAALDVVGGVWVNGFEPANAPNLYHPSTGILSFSRSFATICAGVQTFDASVAGTSTIYSVIASPILTNLASSYFGIQISPLILSSSGSGAVVGCSFNHTRTTSGDLATPTVVGSLVNVRAFTGAASAASYNYSTINGFQFAHNFNAAGTTVDLAAFNAGPITLALGHVVTTAYGLRLQAAAISGGASITNRWGISQEDALASNVLAGKTAMGQAAATVATAQADLGASTTAAASLRIRSGVAPTAPNDGDIWFDGTNLKMRVAGVTKTFTLV